MTLSRCCTAHLKYAYGPVTVDITGVVSGKAAGSDYKKHTLVFLMQ